MDRPATSKSRGICRYYSTPRGCFAGDSCKFLHGTDDKLTPYDKAKVCRYYARGHCTRGDRCWFRHVLPMVASDDERVQFSAETCCICLERPTTYGLLNCSHVFCLECIRQWRAPSGKSPDVVSSGTIKCCPLCRTPSRFVTPSAHFFSNDSPRKRETIDAYKASMARVPCKYFEETSRTGKPLCPFGTDCFYQHANPDGTPHVFRHGAKHSMTVFRRHRRGARFEPPARFEYDDPIEFLQYIFENPITNLHATLDVIRASLPALMEGLAASNELGGQESGGEGDSVDGFTEALEILVNSVTHDETTTPPFTAGEAGSLQSTPVASPPEPVSQPTQTPLVAETRTASQSTRPSSRFSRVMSTQSRQTFVIDISDDDEEEEEEESAQTASDTEPNNSIERPLSASAPVPQSASPQSTPSAANPRTDMPLSRPQLEHDVDPPFVTDGRGRVVWSSTRNVSGRGAAAEGRAVRHSRAGSAPRITCPSPSSPFIVPTARGHAWSGQDAQGTDEKVGGGEQSSDMD